MNDIRFDSHCYINCIVHFENYVLPFHIISHCLVIVDFLLWSQGSQSGVAARPPAAVRRSSGHETGGSLGLFKEITWHISFLNRFSCVFRTSFKPVHLSSGVLHDIAVHFHVPGSTGPGLHRCSLSLHPGSQLPNLSSEDVFVGQIGLV